MNPGMALLTVSFKNLHLVLQTRSFKEKKIRGIISIHQDRLQELENTAGHSLLPGVSQVLCRKPLGHATQRENDFQGFSIVETFQSPGPQLPGHQSLPQTKKDGDMCVCSKLARTPVVKLIICLCRDLKFMEQQQQPWKNLQVSSCLFLNVALEEQESLAFSFLQPYSRRCLPFNMFEIRITDQVSRLQRKTSDYNWE